MAAQAGVPQLAASSLKAALDADWDDPAARDEALARVLAHGKRRVAIHAEDEARMQSRLGERIEHRRRIELGRVRSNGSLQASEREVERVALQQRPDAIARAAELIRESGTGVVVAAVFVARSLLGTLRGKRVAIVLTGANVDPEMIGRAILAADAERLAA